MASTRILGLLSISLLLFSHIQASSILEEGLSYVRRGIEQAAVSVATPTGSIPIVTPTTPPPPVVRPPTPPPPSFSSFPPPPTQVTNRALLYNRPIQLQPGEFLVYTPQNFFNVIGAPPSVSFPDVEKVLDNLEPEKALPPNAQAIFQAIGPAIATVPKPAQQSFVNLLTPDIKSIPQVSQAIAANGLQGSPQASTSSGGSSSSSSAGTVNYKVALSLITLFVSLFFILF